MLHWHYSWKDSQDFISQLRDRSIVKSKIDGFLFGSNLPNSEEGRTYVKIPVSSSIFQNGYLVRFDQGLYDSPTYKIIIRYPGFH